MRFYVERAVEGTEGRAQLHTVGEAEEAQFIREQIQGNHLFMPDADTRPHRLYDLATLEDSGPEALTLSRGIRLSNGHVYDVHTLTETATDYPVQTHFVRAGIVRSSMRPLLAALLARDASTVIVCDNANLKVWERLAREKVGRRGLIKLVRSAHNVETGHITIVSHAAVRRLTELPAFDRLIVCDPLTVTAWPHWLRPAKWAWVMTDWADVRTQPVHALALLKLLHIHNDDPHLLCQVQRLCCGALHTPRLAPVQPALVPCECADVSLPALYARTIVGEQRDVVTPEDMGAVARERRAAVREALFDNEDACNICLTEKADCTTNCGHVFCARCIARVHTGACPVCRHPNFSVMFTQPADPPSKIRWLRDTVKPGGRTLVLTDRDFMHAAHSSLRTAVPASELAKMEGAGRVRAGRLMAFADAFTVVTALNEQAEPDVSRVRTCLLLHVPASNEYRRWLAQLHDSVNVVALSLGSVETGLMAQVMQT